uniref:Transmembrane serine protease 3a n=1 Tax=Sphaeramia orbicularis TaxID=375764 RepID=A0A672ZG87_9TELE
RFKMLKVSDVEVSHSPSKYTCVCVCVFSVGLSCVGKFRCGLSSKCIPSSAQCDGKFQCDNGEDELGCVRLSGRSSVLQVQRGGVWLTVCSEDWTNWLGESACRQLGYSRYVESFFVPMSSIELEFRSNLVSIDSGQNHSVKLYNATTIRYKHTENTETQCGSRPRFTTRIVGGNLSRPGQFPWQVSLHIGGEHLCGGSIITSRWIVTAAHCMEGFADPSIWGVHVGLTELPAHLAQSLSVEQILYHAKYRRSKLDYDIALIKLKTPLVFNGEDMKYVQILKTFTQQDLMLYHKIYFC